VAPSVSGLLYHLISRIPAAASASAPTPAHSTSSWGGLIRRRRIARVTFEGVIRVRRTKSGVTLAVRASCLVVGCMRAFRWVVRRVVRRVRIVSAFVRRSSGIRVCRVVSLVDWWWREVIATWVRSLRLIIADAVVRWGCVIAAIFIGGVRFAVVVFGASFFAVTTLAVSVLVIRISARANCASGESSSRQLPFPALAPSPASASSVWTAGAGASSVPPPIHTRLFVAVVSAGTAFRVDRVIAVSYSVNDCATSAACLCSTRRR